MANFMITGAGRGIGLELTRQALAAGHHVTAAVRDTSSDALRKLRQENVDHLLLVELDVADDSSIAGAKKSVGDASIDVLINNAGIMGPKRQSALDMDYDGLLQTLVVNSLGPMRVTEAFLPNIRKSANGKIVAISSQMGSMASSASNSLAYRTSKAALNKLFQGLASDLKRDGIAAIVMHPGWVRTDMGGSGADISPEQSAKGILAVIDGLSLSKSGQFINYDGKDMPW